MARSVSRDSAELSRELVFVPPVMPNAGGEVLFIFNVRGRPPRSRCKVIASASNATRRTWSAASPIRNQCARPPAAKETLNNASPFSKATPRHSPAKSPEAGRLAFGLGNGTNGEFCTSACTSPANTRALAPTTRATRSPRFSCSMRPEQLAVRARTRGFRLRPRVRGFSALASSRPPRRAHFARRHPLANAPACFSNDK